MLSIDRALYIAYRDIQMIAEDEMLQEFLDPRKETKGVIPNSIPGSLIVTNHSASIVPVNQATLYLLGYEEKSYPELAKSFGVDVTLSKPFSFKELYDVLIQLGYVSNSAEKYRVQKIWPKLRISPLLHKRLMSKNEF